MRDKILEKLRKGHKQRRKRNISSPLLACRFPFIFSDIKCYRETCLLSSVFDKSDQKNRISNGTLESIHVKFALSRIGEFSSSRLKSCILYGPSGAAG